MSGYYLDKGVTWDGDRVDILGRRYHMCKVKDLSQKVVMNVVILKDCLKPVKGMRGERQDFQLGEARHKLQLSEAPK